MLTMAQVLDYSGVREIHFQGRPGFRHAGCTFTVGARGGAKHHPVTARRNGMVQTWKTRPEDYSAPFKYGLRDAFRLTPDDAPYWTTEDDCPACTAAREYRRMGSLPDASSVNSGAATVAL